MTKYITEPTTHWIIPNQTIPFHRRRRRHRPRPSPSPPPHHPHRPHHPHHHHHDLIYIHI